MFDDYRTEERMTQGLLSLFIGWAIYQPAVHAIVGSESVSYMTTLCAISFLVSSICAEPEFWDQCLSQKFEILSILFLLLEPVVSLGIAICWLWIGLSSSVRLVIQLIFHQVCYFQIASYTAILITIGFWWYRFTRMPESYKY